MTEGVVKPMGQAQPSVQWAKLRPCLLPGAEIRRDGEFAVALVVVPGVCRALRGRSMAKRQPTRGNRYVVD